MKTTTTLLWVAACCATQITFADQLPAITVTESVTINPNTSAPDNINRSRATSADGGEFLRQIPGVSMSRFGGRGLEPIVRGQSQTRLNILLDNAYVHGGCPNRMDPPASWAALETYEKVTLLKGVQSLIYGAGGSGGTVLFERDTRSLAEDQGIHGRTAATTADNGIQSDLLADLLAAGDKQYLRLIGEYKDAKNYKDGADQEVRSAFHHKQGGMVLGLTPTTNRLFELTIEKNDFSDALYPGAGMDSPREQGNFYRFRYKDRYSHGLVSRLSLETYLNDIDHLMDNFSLRTPPVYPASHPKAGNPMKRNAQTTSKTSGGRLLLVSNHAGDHWEYGLNIEHRHRDATLNNLNSGVAKTLSFLWPDVTVEQTGLFAEATHPLPQSGRLKYGLRIDRVRARARKTDNQPILKTANQAYQIYYGHEARDQDETNIGALLRFERTLTPGITFFTGLSRSIRTADATERYINKWAPKASLRWIGNPAIKPEKHHQIDIGLMRQQSLTTLSASAYLDKVSDYILRDSARGQTGILQTDNADIYRNIDADIHGVELEGKIHTTDRLDLSGDLAWVHATNTTDHDRPLPQIPPLNGKIQLDFSGHGWNIGARARFAAQQNRIDPFSKQEVGKTPGWTAVDIYANHTIGETFNLRVGIDNLLDRTYAEHASRANLLDPNAIRVNEPGRTIWLKLAAEF